MNPHYHRLFLFSSPTCELCDKAEALFYSYENEQDGSSVTQRFKLTKVNILTIPVLHRRYAWSIPVLYKPTRRVFSIDSGETGNGEDCSAETSAAGGTGVSDRRAIKMASSDRTGPSLLLTPDDHLAQQLVASISEEALLTEPLVGSARKQDLDISLPIHEGGLKLENELYWPFPSSRLRDFLSS